MYSHKVGVRWVRGSHRNKTSPPLGTERVSLPPPRHTFDVNRDRLDLPRRTGCTTVSLGLVGLFGHDGEGRKGTIF